jgi:aryl-alcohol dehydrogenase-like predicted oxidoreductase
MADLERRTLGRTGLPVTVLGYGAMELRNDDWRLARSVDARQADRVLNEVLDGGINYIDTSPDYGDSEESIGRAIGHRRDEFFLASKCGCLLDIPPNTPRPTPHVFTRENIVGAVDRSLRRMQTDHLDVLQCHVTPSREQLEREGGIEAMVELRDEGKVRFIGCSSTLPNLADHIEMGVFDVFQIPYSALEREHEALMIQAAETGAGIVIRGGVAQGEPGPGRGVEAKWARWDAAGLDDLLDGETRTEFMMRFTISHPTMATTIVGTQNSDHLAQNLEVARRGPLTPDIYNEATRRLDAVWPH